MKEFSSKHLIFILIAILTISLVSHFLLNASSDLMGKDESLYIFLARGNYSHEAIDAPRGNIVTAITKGMTRTADPPGFFIALHVWQYISFAEPWLRLLPFLFFIGSIIVLIKIVSLMDIPPPLNILLGFLPLASTNIVKHALEIRCYIMELFFTYLIIYLCLKLLKSILSKNQHNDRSSWTIFTLNMILGLTTRFSFVISAASAYGIFWLLIFLDKKYRKNVLKPLLFSSVSTALFFIALISLKIIYAKIDPLNSVPADFNMYMIEGGIIAKLLYPLKELLKLPQVLFGGSNISEYFNVLKTSFYDLIHFLKYGFMAFFSSENIETFIWKTLKYSLILGIAYKSYNLMKSKIDLPKLKAHFQNIPLINKLIFLLSAMATVLTLFLAYLSLYPFQLTTRWAIFLQPYFHLIIITLCWLFLYKYNKTKKTFILNKNTYKHFVRIIFIMALIYAFSFMFFKVTAKTGGGQIPHQVITKTIPEKNLKNIDHWFISIGEANAFKYQVLYGSLKNKLAPNANVLIEKRPVSIRAITCLGIENIKQNTLTGDKVIMLIGHVTPQMAEIYRKIFKEHFKDAKFGEFERTAEQMGYVPKL